MCGITGVIALTEKGKLQIPKLQQSVRSLHSRGPDDEGTYTHDHVGFGQRRLSIIDTSKAANQPMWDKTRRYAIIYNGEVFNYRELKEKYFSPDEQARFRTSSDTEVVLELFIRKGAACLSLLDGFFAFAIYDTAENHLFIARDRFGKKPLYYYKDEDCFLFGSEMKALFAFGIPKELNYEALKLYLQFSYIPQPLSMLKHVQKVNPGSYLTLEKGEIRETKWYELPVTEKYDPRLSYAQAQRRLVSLLEEAVVKRLISDVPLGAFLSGGIDSSVVVALASRHKDSLNTFSIGFREKKYCDETRYAEIVAKKFNTKHARFSLGIQDYLDHIYDVLDYLDEPFADTSSLPQYILCYETRKLATVAVSGDGGDEVFAGYNKHYAEWQARRRSLPGLVARLGGPLWKALPKGREGKITNLVRQLDRFAEISHMSSKDRYWYWASMFAEQEVCELLSEDANRQADRELITKVRDRYLEHISDKDLNSVLRTDMDLVLAGDMLVKVDLMSMANSVEVRSPFLDHHVVEYAFSIPAHYKINGRGRKRIVKDAFRQLLPDEIYHRGKQGFEVPMLGWFRNELHSFIFDDMLNEQFIKDQGLFNYEFISGLKKQLFSTQSGSIVEQLWILIVFQYWYKKYFT